MYLLIGSLNWDIACSFPTPEEPEVGDPMGVMMRAYELEGAAKTINSNNNDDDNNNNNDDDDDDDDKNTNKIKKAKKKRKVNVKKTQGVAGSFSD